MEQWTPKSRHIGHLLRRVKSDLDWSKSSWKALHSGSFTGLPMNAQTPFDLSRRQNSLHAAVTIKAPQKPKLKNPRKPPDPTIF
jgi:hypothetical protein